MFMTHFRILALAVLLGTSSVAFRQSREAEGTTAEVSPVAKQFSQLDQGWLDAVRLGDADYLDQLFAKDFVEMNASGEVLGKHEQIERIKARQRQVKGIQLDRVQVLYASPTVAILSDMTTTNESGSGTEPVRKYRTLRVFVKQQGTWRAAGAAFTQTNDPLISTK
jgi:ketosteroid isomerase-like protein